MIYLSLFLTFLKIGAFTFGGGYAMLPLIEEAVLQHGWLDEKALVDFIAVSESTPGPFAINIATCVGQQQGGLFGALCATGGVVLPSFTVILLIARIYERFQKSRIVVGCMKGLKPATIGLIAVALLSVGKAAFFPDGFFGPTAIPLSFWISLGVFAISFVLIRKKCHPIWIILLAAAIGLGTGFGFSLPVAA